MERTIEIECWIKPIIDSQTLEKNRELTKYTVVVFKFSLIWCV